MSYVLRKSSTAHRTATRIGGKQPSLRVCRSATGRVDTSSSMVLTAEQAGLLLDRVKGALWGIFIADALSMPVHWYYDVGALQRDFGQITDYQAPKSRHPGSIMSVSSTGGHGRGGQQGRIIGDVINHGKHDFWGKPGVHYHQGMLAGENTLNALCARVVMRGMASRKGYDPRGFLTDYVTFMTTPGSHNDTYAESFHRDFFKNWASGVPPEQCARGTEGHNTAQIGGFVMLPPIILGHLHQGLQVAKDQALKHLSLTHESRKLSSVAELYAELIYKVATGEEDLKTAVAASARSVGLDVEKMLRYNYDDVQAIHQQFGSACYIESSYPSVMYLSYKYADSFEKAVLANTNVGGENCHRGAALGAIMGAAAGESGIPPRLITGLHDHEEIKKEIDDFVEALFPEEVALTHKETHKEEL